MRSFAKFNLILIFLLFSGISLGQVTSGRVISDKTQKGIGFVNIGIIGKNKGTVADAEGNFSIDLEEKYDNDSIRFSMLGYEPRTYSVVSFRHDTSKCIQLSLREFNLEEVRVTYHRPRILRLGVPVESNALRSGFAYNDLGSEMGVMISARKPVLLTDLYINVGTCTYDTVAYRMNLYKKEKSGLYKNILNSPVYVSFSKDQTAETLGFNIKKYSIIVQGEVLVTLELYKNLGEGRLLFRTQNFTGITYHKKTSEGTWTKSAGAIGLYLEGLVVNSRY